MPFVLKPSRNKTLQLAYALMAAEERKAKKAAKKEAEPQAPKTVKKFPNQRAKRAGAKR